MSLPSRDNGDLFCSFVGETQLFRNVLCFSRLRGCWGDPQKNTVPQILSLCSILLDSALETQPQPACQGNFGLFTALSAPLSPCSGITPWFGHVYSSSQGWVSTGRADSIPTLPLTRSFSSSKPCLPFSPKQVK